MTNDNVLALLENIVSKYFKDYNPSFFVLDFIKNLNFMNDEKLLCICNDFLSSNFDYNDLMSIKIRNRVLSELEIFQRKIILESKPRDIQVVLTNKCNLRCKMCVNDRIKWELPKETLESIKNNMKYMERILWQGGEAFLYTNFLDLLILAHENCVVQSIMTNGLLIDEKAADVITKTNTDIVISIDSVTPSIYESIRSGAKFEQLINSLELLSKYRAINNSKTSLDMATIIMHSTCRDLFNFIDFAEKYQFRSICLNQIGINDKDQEESLTDDDLEFLISNKSKLIDRIKNSPVRFEMNLPCLYVKKQTQGNKENKNEQQIKTKEDIKVEKKGNINIEQKQKLYCQRPWNSIYVEYKGFFMPTCKCYGGFMEQIDNKTIEDIWNSKVFTEYRKQLIENNFINVCSNICNNTKNNDWKYK